MNGEISKFFETLEFIVPVSFFSSKKQNILQNIIFQCLKNNKTIKFSLEKIGNISCKIEEEEDFEI